MSHEDYSGVQGDPLARIGVSLVAAVGGKQARRRRQGRLLTVGMVSVGLLTATTGAVAVTGTSTGVPAIDRWLDVVDEQALLRSADDGPQPDTRPAAGSVSQPFDVDLGDGARATGVGYQSRDGAMCTALSDPEANARQPMSGSGGCVSARLLAAELRTMPARTVSSSGINTSSDAPATVVTGFARGDVQEIVVAGPGGKRLEVGLSKPWKPSDWQGDPLRAYVAVVTGQVADLRAGPPLRDLRTEAVLADGRRVVVRP